jgi:hypothetical protein
MVWGVAGEPAFAGSIGQYLGEQLRLTPANGAFELTASGALLGRLTRPGEAYLAETRDGSWELTHSPRSVARIEIRDPGSGAPAAQYRRRLLGSGGAITGLGGTVYRLGRARRDWQVTDPQNARVMTLSHRTGDTRVQLQPFGETAPSSDLSMLALLCAYILLLTDQSAPSVGGYSPIAP